MLHIFHQSDNSGPFRDGLGSFCILLHFRRVIKLLKRLTGILETGESQLPGILETGESQLPGTLETGESQLPGFKGTGESHICKS